MEAVLVVVVILIALALYEYRLRKPDQIVIAEARDGVRLRGGRIFPRHFSTPITKTTHSFTQTVDASAKGSLDVRVKLAVTVAASMDDLAVLVKVGGWAPDAIARAARELETLILGYVKGYTELHEVEELSSDRIRGYLQERVQESKHLLGLEVITLTIASYDPVNPQIAEAIRQREHARILERTEVLNQQARVAATRVRLHADEEIAALEHALEIRKTGLKHAEFEKESALAGSRAEHELSLKKMQLDFEKDELRLLKESPELLLLTPQAARLAEASQSMRNARTVVSLSPPDGVQGTEILSMFSTLVQKALGALSERKKK
jgi:regulator of protease activity HflC (stomatin/prohibitin superfamily)